MSNKVSRMEIVSAFISSKEISNAERFAGRKEFVNDAFYGLWTEGANLAI